MRSDVYNIDCLVYMRTLPNDYFDIAIADPPYGINISNNPFRQKFDKSDWDANVPTNDFFDELFRVSKNQVIWGGNYFNLPPTKCFLIWDKIQPFDFSSAMCEFAWTSFDSPAKIFRKHPTHEVNRIHPTQKSIELYAWIMKHYAQKGDLIFDPMIGSGSSRIAAYQLGFDFVGCEIEPLYYIKANERFNRICKGIIKQSDGKILTQTNLFT